MMKIVKEAWICSDLNAQGLFKTRASLKFAELNHIAPFIKGSHLQENFNALLVGNKTS
jgi:hypothetical protein